MITLTSVDKLRAQIKVWKDQGACIGFVPTMGNLHVGHIELIRQAQKHADRIVASIFVNPLQFGPNEDYDLYPRTIEQDEEKLLSCETDLLFLPDVEAMYGNQQEQTTVVSVPELNSILCGALRPGHFDGVATVVSKLFNQVMPDVAVFGEKDYQQLLIIRRICRDLAFPVRIVGVPTQREADGLALSSRNAYLTPSERQAAPLLYATLKEIATEISSGNRDYKKLSLASSSRLKEEGFSPEYVEIRRLIDLKFPEKADNSLIILVAARLGKARLIDNLAIDL